MYVDTRVQCWKRICE